jgi:hypothetical protein
MKRPTLEKIMLAIFTCTVCACLVIYFVGMFVLRQQTNELNLPLRNKLVDLLGFIAAQTLAIVYIMLTGGKSKEDK